MRRIYVRIQGASAVAYWLSVAVDATQKTDVKTSNLVHFIKFTILIRLGIFRRVLEEASLDPNMTAS